MEQLIVIVSLCAVIGWLLYGQHRQSKREDRLIEGLKQIAYSQCEPLKIACQHIRSMHTITEQQSDLMLKVSEAAPQKTQIEVQRMQLAFEVDRTRAEAEMKKIPIPMNPDESGYDSPSAIPTSQSNLE